MVLAQPIIGIDPGTTRSAWVEYCRNREAIIASGLEPNDTVLERLRGDWCGQRPAIEMIASYGMPVGKETFQTVLWIGRFYEAAGGVELVYRQDVKLLLCNSARAKDANVRQALIDRHEPCGGGATPQVGTKSQPGPLYGIRSDIWSALAVAIYYDWKLRQRDKATDPNLIELK